MVLRDLSAEHEADAGALGFRGKKRHEEIRRIGEARTVVLDGDLQLRAIFFPTEAHAAAGFLGGFDGIFGEIDEDLFDLRGVTES